MSEKNLNSESESLGLTEALRLGDLSDHLRFRDQQLRETVAGQIIGIFKWANIATISLVILFAAVDIFFLLKDPSYHRLVTSEVLETLIGATVVQVGAAALAIAISLFPKKNAN